MRLAAKLILLFLVGIFLVVSVFAYSTIESDRRLAILEHQQRAKAIAQAIESDQELGTSREEIIGYKNKPFLQPFQTRTQIRIIELGTAPQTTHANPSGLIFSQQEITTVTRMDESGQPRFYSYLPLSNSDKTAAANQQIEVSDPDSESSQRIRRLWLRENRFQRDTSACVAAEQTLLRHLQRLRIRRKGKCGNRRRWGGHAEAFRPPY